MSLSPWSVTVRAVADRREEVVAFEAETRDEALFEAGIYIGKNYSGRWELVKIDAGWW